MVAGFRAAERRIIGRENIRFGLRQQGRIGCRLLGIGCRGSRRVTCGISCIRQGLCVQCGGHRGRRESGRYCKRGRRNDCRSCCGRRRGRRGRHSSGPRNNRGRRPDGCSGWRGMDGDGGRSRNGRRFDCGRRGACGRRGVCFRRDDRRYHTTVFGKPFLTPFLRPFLIGMRTRVRVRLGICRL